MLIYPSLLPIFDKVGNDRQALIAAALAAQAAGADGLHLDFMAPPVMARTTFDVDIVQFLREGGITMPLDVHLMTGPEWIDKILFKSIQSLTFHAKAVDDLNKCSNYLAYMQDNYILGGLAIDLDEEIEPLSALLIQETCKCVVLMTVQAGVGGQAFQAQALNKIEQIQVINHKIKIMIDGGITANTLPVAARAGAYAAVAGSAIFNSQDIELNIKNLRGTVK